MPGLAQPRQFFDLLDGQPPRIFIVELAPSGLLRLLVFPFPISTGARISLSRVRPNGAALVAFVSLDSLAHLTSMALIRAAAA
jgi:hypothetical protein